MMRVALRPLLALLVAVCLTGCAPEFWEAMAQGMAATSNSYAPSTGSSPEASNDQVVVCAKYMTQAGWSHGYQVKATVLKGSELNRRTSTYNYEAYATYVVIFWAQGEASVLKLEYYYGSLTAIGTDATDQEGRKWTIAKTSVCY